MGRKSLFAFALLAVAVATPAAARAQDRPFVELGEVADAPNGFIELCARDQGACGAATRAVAEPAEALAPQPRVGTISAMFYSGAIATRPSGPADRSARHGDATRRMVERINEEVNRRVVQRADLDRFGVDERWERAGAGPRAAGDCEDIALEKRAELIDAGMPAAKLLLATVYRPRTGLHTVLIARLDAGDMLLDSLTTAFRPWYRSIYTWLRIQSPDDPRVWRRISRG